MARRHLDRLTAFIDARQSDLGSWVFELVQVFFTRLTLFLFASIIAMTSRSFEPLHML